MEKANLKVTKVAGAILVAALLFPPWEYTFQAQGIGQTKKPAGYSFLFAPPSPESEAPYFGIQIDYGKLAIELVTICIIAGVSILVRNQKEKDA